MGDHGKVSAAEVEEALAAAHKGVVHHVQPAAISLTQATESGTSYRPAEVAAIAAAGKRYGVRLHMDGARFANALTFLKVSPAEITWRAGVDILSFGATKNGALAAEAVVIFDKARPRNSPSGASARAISSPRCASSRPSSTPISRAISGCSNAAPCQCHGQPPGRGAGGAFPAPSSPIPWRPTRSSSTCRRHAIRGLQADGFQFYRWLGEDQTLLRLVTAFDTKEADVAAFIASAKRHAARANEKVA